MKKLLATTAIVMTTAIPAMAEQHSMNNGGSPFIDSSNMESSADLRASRLIGMSVYTSEAQVEADEMAEADAEWERIGEISEVILSRSGDMEAVLLDIGGFLGMGERTVAVKLSELKMVADSDDADDFFVVLNANREAVENAPEFDTAMVGAWNSLENATEDAADAAGDAANEAANAAETVATEAGQEVEEAADATGAAMENAGEEVEQTAEAAGQEIEQETDEMAADAEAAGDRMTNETDEMAADAEGATAADMMSPEGYVAADASRMTADDLDGARVYDGSDEWIGEISQVIVAEDGKISNVIVDVGGFLGLGEKPVSMPFDKLNLQQEDGGDDLRVYVTSTKEELENMEEYDM